MTDIATESAKTDRALFAGRILFISIALTPIVAAGLGWYYTDGGTRTVASPAMAWLYVWGGSTLAGLALWGVVRGRALAMVRDSGRSGLDAEERLAALQTRLILSWAGAELVGLAGVGLFLVSGRGTLLLASVCGSLLLFALTYPRRDWYEQVAG